MEKVEEKLIEKKLGRDFLKAAKTYGANMRLACAGQGANENVQAALERIATVGFAKGASFFKECMWVKLAKSYPKLNTWLLCKGESGELFLAKFVKIANGAIKPKDKEGYTTEPVVYWMEIPEIEEEENKEAAQ